MLWLEKIFDTLGFIFRFRFKKGDTTHIKNEGNNNINNIVKGNGNTIHNGNVAINPATTINTSNNITTVHNGNVAINPATTTNTSNNITTVSSINDYGARTIESVHLGK